MKARIARALRRLADRMDPPPRAQWHALPGNTLELGATGYRIELKPDDPSADLIVWSPEGERIASAHQGLLGECKDFAEKCAKNRDEFTPKEIWKP